MICFYANYKNYSFPTKTTSQKYLLKLGKVLFLKLKKTLRKHRSISLEIRAENEHFTFSRWIYSCILRADGTFRTTQQTRVFLHRF